MTQGAEMVRDDVVAGVQAARLVGPVVRAVCGYLEGPVSRSAVPW